MKSTVLLLVCFVGGYLVFGTVVLDSGKEQTLQSAFRLAPKVLAFYYAWYGTPEFSGHWNHWKAKHSEISKSENGRDHLSAILSTNRPAIGLYDSKDPIVILDHISWAVDVGIDAFICSWEGQDHVSDQGLELIADEIENRNLPLDVCAYYERVPRSDAEAALEDFLYILEKYGKRSSYLKVNGKPVIFVFHRAMSQLPMPQWKAVIEIAKHNRDFVVVGAGSSMELLRWFDGLHFYSPNGMISGGADIGKAYAAFVKDGRKMV